MKETKFKQTEVGMIPSDWDISYLGDVGSVKMCKRVMKFQTAEKGDIPFYKIGTFGKEPDAYISRDLYEYLKNKYSFPKKGDVLISAAGTIGRTVVFDGKDSFFQDSNIVWLEHDESVMTNQYLYYLYQVVEWKTENGGIVSRLYNDNFRVTPVALPSSKEEQQRIANALSDVDSLIANLEKLIAKKKNIKQGAMQQLLTGRKRLPAFAPAKPTYKQTELGPIPADWEVKKIGDFCKVFDGTHQTPNYVDVGIPFYSVENVSADDFEHTRFISEREYEQISKRAVIEKGDVLMTRIGSIGVCKYVDWDCKAGFYVSLALLKCNESIDARFICQLSSESGFKKEIELHSLTTAIPQKINLGPISQVRIALPSSKEEQIAIANILSDMDSEIQTLKTKLAKYRKLKTGMMQQLLTGKIRLVD